MEPFPEKVSEASRKPLPAPKALDRMLDDAKDSDQDAEDESLVKCWVNQGLLFKAATQAQHRANHDDFRKDQRLNQGHPIVRANDVMGSENEPAVLRESGEHVGEINDV